MLLKKQSDNHSSIENKLKQQIDELIGENNQLKQKEISSVKEINRLQQFKKKSNILSILYINFIHIHELLLLINIII